MERKNYNLNERCVKVIQDTAKEKQISLSEALRRIIEFYKEQCVNGNKKERKNQ